MFPDKETARELAEAHCEAWTALSAATVAETYAESTSFAINGDDPMTTRTEIAEMASGIIADFPDLVLTCDVVLVADHHMVYAWTFEGHHADSGNQVRFSGWEESELDDDLKVTKSLGWCDAEAYDRQVAG